MKPETVTLKLEVPKGVIDFLADLFTLGGTYQTPKEFLEEELVSSVKTIVADLPRTWFDAQDILKRYRLDDEPPPNSAAMAEL